MGLPFCSLDVRCGELVMGKSVLVFEDLSGVNVAQGWEESTNHYLVQVDGRLQMEAHVTVRFEDGRPRTFDFKIRGHGGTTLPLTLDKDVGSLTWQILKGLILYVTTHVYSGEHTEATWHVTVK